MVTKLLRTIVVVFTAICLLIAGLALCSMRNRDAVYYVQYRRLIGPHTDLDAELCLYDGSTILLIEHY